MFLPHCERPSFTPVQNNGQNYSSVYHNLYIFGKQIGRQNVLHRMIASIRLVWLLFNFFMNAILIGMCFSKMFELFHSFKGFVICLYVAILSCILFMRHEHVLIFLTCGFFNSTLLSANKLRA